MMTGVVQHYDILNPAVKARVLMSFLSVRKNQMGSMKVARPSDACVRACHHCCKLTTPLTPSTKKSPPFRAVH
jgi:hypothetical protein